MKFIIFAVVALVILALLSIGFYQLYQEPPFDPLLLATTADEPIAIYDKDKLKIINPDCDVVRKEMTEVLIATQSCKSNKDCSTGLHHCSIVLNVTNHTKFHELEKKIQYTCGYRTISSCPATEPSTNQCINQVCVSVRNLDPATEVRKILDHQ